MLKIYFLERKDSFRATYDEMASCVVVADSAGAARAMAHDSTSSFSENRETCWLNPQQTTCKQLGTANPRGSKPGVVCADVWEG